MNPVRVWLAVAMALGVGCAAARAGLPERINYQGQLLDAVGDPVTGAVGVAVSLYDAETAGRMIYTQHVGQVALADGLFSFEWGGAGLDSALTNAEVWMEVRVNEDALEPRRRLQSVPYALRASRAETLEDAAGGAGLTVTELVHMAMPSGAVLPYAGSAAPAGFFLCDGAAVSRTAYAALFAAIGTTYGAGDGSTTFNLPDLRGRVPAGLQAGDSDFGALNGQGGAKTHTLTVSQMPTHNHGVNDPGHSHSISTAGNDCNSAGAPTGDPVGMAGCPKAYTTRSTQSSGSGISIQNAGSGQPHNIMQPYIVLNYIIKQ